MRFGQHTVDPTNDEFGPPWKLRVGASTHAHRHRLLAFIAILGLAFNLTGCLRLAPKSDIIRISEPDSSVAGQAAFRLGMHAYRKGHIEHAITELDKAIRVNPRHGAAHNNLGLIYYQQRKLALAATHFDAAREVLPTDPTPLNNLGMTFEAGGRVMEALGYYQRASELAPENPLYLGNLVRARVRLGEHSEELIEELRYLAFIETRPDWLAWTDEQLAIAFNPMLDRGPAVQENPFRRQRDRADQRIYRGSLSDDSSELEVLEPEVLELQPPADESSNGTLPIPDPIPDNPTEASS